MLPPLVFQPLLKRIRWGGRRLGTRLHKPIGDESDYAESWEIADHGDDQSIVADGPLKGFSLHRLIGERNVDLLGRHAGLRQFPLLVKFLDAADRLSVQVHPDDRLARQFDPEENGKTEAWVILDAEPGSVVYAGLAEPTTRESLQDSLQRGLLEERLHRVPVRPGDCLFVPAGTVHAIGEGILLAEIQQSSDLTFRLYDWGRAGADGRPRELHIEQALQCIRFDSGPVHPVQPRAVDLAADSFVTGAGEGALEELVRCDHFVMRRYLIPETLSTRPDDRFRVWMILAGSGKLRFDGESVPLGTGRTVLLPARSPHVRLEAERPLTILEAFLP